MAKFSLSCMMIPYSGAPLERCWAGDVFGTMADAIACVAGRTDPTRTDYQITEVTQPAPLAPPSAAAIARGQAALAASRAAGRTDRGYPGL